MHLGPQGKSDRQRQRSSNERYRDGGGSVKCVIWDPDGKQLTRRHKSKGEGVRKFGNIIQMSPLRCADKNEPFRWNKSLQRYLVENTTNEMVSGLSRTYNRWWGHHETLETSSRMAKKTVMKLIIVVIQWFYAIVVPALDMVLRGLQHSMPLSLREHNTWWGCRFKARKSIQDRVDDGGCVTSWRL